MPFIKEIFGSVRVLGKTLKKELWYFKISLKGNVHFNAINSAAENSSKHFVDIQFPLVSLSIGASFAYDNTVQITVEITSGISCSVCQNYHFLSCLHFTVKQNQY